MRADKCEVSKRKSVQVGRRCCEESYNVKLSFPLPCRVTLKLISAINVPSTKKQRKNNIEKRNEKEQKILRIQPGITISVRGLSNLDFEDTHSLTPTKERERKNSNERLVTSLP